MYTDWVASAACVVSNASGSSESGAVPNVIVTVPPALPVLVPPLVEDFLLEPHALSAATEANARPTINADLVNLLIYLLLLRGLPVPRAGTLVQDSGSANRGMRFLINPQHGVGCHVMRVGPRGVAVVVVPFALAGSAP